MAKLYEAKDLKAGMVVMLEEVKWTEGEPEMRMRPECIQGIEDGLVDMWNTVQLIGKYGRVWRCWGGLPSLEEQVGARWLTE